MTDFKARQPEGIPVGGQFAAVQHTEPDLALGAPARRPELQGWPESLPEPELKLEIGDEGGISTVLNVEGHGTITVFTDNPSTGRCDYTQFDGEFDDVDEETMEQVVSWTSDKHLAMEYELQSHMKAAAEMVSKSVAARAAGKPAPATDEELNDLIMNAGHLAAEARNTSELANMAMFSREILKRHPDAFSAELETVAYDEGEFIGAAHILDAEGNRMTTYGEDVNDDEDTVTDLLRSMSPDCEDAVWSDYTLRAEGFNAASFEQDGRTLNLKKAAGWSPGA